MRKKTAKLIYVENIKPNKKACFKFLSFYKQAVDLAVNNKGVISDTDIKKNFRKENCI